MATCKGCGRALVTSYWSGKCVFCGRKANVFRASAGKQTFTRRGAVRAARKQVAERAEAVERARAAQRAAREQAKAAKQAEAEAQQRVKGLTWQEAERLACEWMRAHGYPDARLTPPGADGGIDIDSSRAIGQVKRHTKPVVLADMQRMDSIALHHGKRALFFSTGGFTPKAKEWARTHSIEMYEMPPVRRVT